MKLKKYTGITVQVTQRDIDTSEPGCSFSCPVAVAVKRVTRRQNVEVRSTWTEIGDRRFRLPKRVTQFIEAFDTYQIVKPIRFQIGAEL